MRAVMTEPTYRLVTRADFDGIVCGSLLLERGLVAFDDVLFVEPKDVQDGKVALGPHDITANLPYRPEVHLCFDHHLSEGLRVGEQKNLVINPKAPSAARVIYEHFGGKAGFPEIPIDLMKAVDQADSAQYTEEEILAPDGWTLINFILDPRTGLTRFKNFTTPNDQVMRDMMLYLRHHPLDEILKIPDVVERVHAYLEHDEMAEHQIRHHCRSEGSVVVVDLRNEPMIFACSRFTVYALYPWAKVSIQVVPEDNGDRIVLAVGKSILDRSAKINVGALMLEYGGGGHEAVGTCRVPKADADKVLAQIIKRINAAG
jgi:nanoRNase/pAp phosphatase (c-di-AMP/oligoRNAs hydrolase)